MRYSICCGIFSCGQPNEVSEEQYRKGWLSYCDHCHTPTWPMDLGYTGNDRESCIKFANDNPDKYGIINNENE